MATFGSITADTDVNIGTAGQLPGGGGTEASPGNVGERSQSLISSGSAVSLTTATPANVTSLSLTAGNWLVFGNATLKYGSATQSADGQAGLSGTNATLPGTSLIAYDNTRLTTTTTNVTIQAPFNKFNSGSPFTVYLVAQAGFSAGTCEAFGSLTAIRIN